MRDALLPRFRTRSTAGRRLLLALVAASLLVATACAGNDLSNSSGGSSSGASAGASESSSGASGEKGSVTISGQNFTEAKIVANMYSALLDDAGYSTNLKLVGTRDVYMGQFPGDVDVVPEYLGGIADFLNKRANGADAKSITSSDVDQTLSNLKPLADKAGITMLEPSEATDQNAFFVTQDYADKNSLTTLSDLGDSGNKVVLAAAQDCKGRPDCAAGLKNVYGIDITKLLPLGYGGPQVYDSVTKGESQLGETSTTDGTLKAQGLTLLEDDQGIQPAQNLIPAVSSDFLDAHPDVADVLNPLMDQLTTSDLAELNRKVGVNRQQPSAVAQNYLSDAGLL